MQTIICYWLSADPKKHQNVDDSFIAIFLEQAKAIKLEKVDSESSEHQAQVR